jgi:hypothetical protein
MVTHVSVVFVEVMVGGVVGYVVGELEALAVQEAKTVS